jgi:hypothetical protein
MHQSISIVQLLQEIEGTRTQTFARKENLRPFRFNEVFIEDPFQVSPLFCYVW